jgi:hypothetical protein
MQASAQALATITPHKSARRTKRTNNTRSSSALFLSLYVDDTTFLEPDSAAALDQVVSFVCSVASCID